MNLEIFLEWLYNHTIVYFKKLVKKIYIKRHFPKGCFVLDAGFMPCVVIDNSDEILGVISLTHPNIGSHYEIFYNCRNINLGEVVGLIHSFENGGFQEMKEFGEFIFHRPEGKNNDMS